MRRAIWFLLVGAAFALAAPRAGIAQPVYDTPPPPPVGDEPLYLDEVRAQQQQEIRARELLRQREEQRRLERLREQRAAEAEAEQELTDREPPAPTERREPPTPPGEVGPTEWDRQQQRNDERDELSEPPSPIAPEPER